MSALALCEPGESLTCFCGAVLSTPPPVGTGNWGDWECWKCGRRWCQDCGAALDLDRECPDAARKEPRR